MGIRNAGIVIWDAIVMTNEYRIDIKVKNNIILRKIEQAGYKTVGEFCRLNGIMKYVSLICSIISMKESPLQADGEFRKCIIKTADLLNCDPLDLFTDTQLHTILKSNKRSIQVNEAEMKFMLEQQNQTKLLDSVIYDEQKNNIIEKSLGCLTKRERQVIEMRLGLGEYSREHTLDEVGAAIPNDYHPDKGITRERVRHIEARAYRKLRLPINADKLRDFLE